MYWYTWVILIAVVVVITIFGAISGAASMLGSGWRALKEQFPDDQPPEPEATIARSNIYIYGPGQKPTRMGCLAIFMPWKWNFSHTVRLESGIEALRIHLDAGRLIPASSARIPFSELRVIRGGQQIKLAYTFWGGEMGEHVTLAAGSCVIIIPKSQFTDELAAIEQLNPPPEEQIKPPDFDPRAF